MSKRTQWLKGIGGFLIGAIFGLYVVRWFVAFLPGPKIAVDVQGLEATSGNAAGCTLYMFMLNTDEAIDYVYLKIQFPFKITGYKVGLPQEAQTASMGRMDMQVWEVGRNSNGQCEIVQAAINNGDVQVSAAGNMISADVSKLAPKGMIMGAIVTPAGESALNPPPQMYFEGAYEYTKLGQTVRKPLHFNNRGVTEAR